MPKLIELLNGITAVANAARQAQHTGVPLSMETRVAALERDVHALVEALDARLDALEAAADSSVVKEILVPATQEIEKSVSDLLGRVQTLESNVKKPTAAAKKPAAKKGS